MPTVRASTAPSGTLSPSSPASTEIGDLVIVVTATVAGAGVPTHTLQSGDGFTEIFSHSHNDGSTDGRVSVACKVATSAGSNSYQAYTSSGGTSDHSLIIVITKDTHDATLANILSNSVTGTTNAAPNPPALTPTRDGSLSIIGGFWHYSSATTTTVTEPANYSTITSYSGSATCELAVSQRTSSPTSGVSNDPAAYADNTTPNGTVAFQLIIYGQALTMAADTRSYSLTGNDAALEFDRTLAADTRSFTLTGNDAALEMSGGDTPMDAATVAFALSGVNTGLTVQRLLTADTRSFALTGLDTGLTEQKRLTADARSFALTGNDAGLQVGRRLTADVRAFTLTGQDAGLTAARRLTADVRAFSLTGLDTGLTAQRTIGAGVGAFTLTGNDATLTYTPNSGAYEMPADVRAFTLTGNAAGLTAAKRMTADVRAYTLTGVAATLTVTTGDTPCEYAITMAPLTVVAVSTPAPLTSWEFTQAPLTVMALSQSTNGFAIEFSQAPRTVITCDLEETMLDVGDDCIINATLTVDGVATDPTTLAADIYTPAGALTTVTYPAATLTKTATGVYKLVVDCTAAGQWRVRFRSTGTAKGAGRTSFTVRDF